MLSQRGSPLTSPLWTVGRSSTRPGLSYARCTNAMNGVQSIERAFALLRRLGSGPAGVTELAQRVDLPKSTVSRILSTLEGLGAVEQQVPGGPYRIGALMLEITGATQPGRGLLDTARPHLVDLMEATGEAAGISVLDGTFVHYLDQVESKNPVQVRDWSGTRVPLHFVPSGLVLLAHAPRDNQRAYLLGPLERSTPRTMIDPSAIAARLSEIRSQGYAWVFEEFSLGINSVGAPIRDGQGTVVAAIHAHGPAYRFPQEGREAEIAAIVVTAAVRVEAGLRSTAIGRGSETTTR